MISELFSNHSYKNKPIIIFGAGMIARAAIITIKTLDKKREVQIIGCGVSKAVNNVREIEEIAVYDYRELSGKYPDAVTVVAVRDKYYEDVFELLKECNSKGYIRVSVRECVEILEEKWRRTYPSLSEKFIQKIDMAEITDEEYILFLSKQLKTGVINLEVNVCDHCNLNCQSCNHFSPLIKEKNLDEEQYIRDLNRINNIYSGKVGRIMLLGGEPLMNDRITEICEVTRKILPDSAVYICTNGLMFPQMDKKFWRICREKEIGIKVTKYPVSFDYEYWQHYAEINGVSMSDESTEEVKTTYKLPLSTEAKWNPWHNYMKCYLANQCVVLRDGKLYTCPIGAWVDYLNKYFGLELPELDANAIDIYENDNVEQIEDFLKKPTSLCAYCGIDKYEYDIPWAISKREIKEWMD